MNLLTMLGMLGGVVVSTPVAAQTQIDDVRSYALFELPLLLVGSVKGRFPQISGSVVQVAAGVQVCATVAVAGAQMRRERDKDELLGANFFNVAVYPSLRFESAPLARSKLQAGASVVGKLTVRGVSRPAQFTLTQLHCPAANAVSTPDSGCSLLLEGAIRRADFGMRARRAVLGNSVALQLYIQLCDANLDSGCGQAQSSCPD